MKLRREFKPSSREYVGRAGSPRTQKRSQRKWRFSRFSLGAIISLVLLIVLVALLSLPQIRISSVVIQGARIENVGDIQKVAFSALEGSYFFVIPKNSIFFYPSRKIISDIEALYPRITNVSLAYRTATSITVSFEERIPAALWCEGEGACAFLDSAGYAFARAPHFSGSVFFEVGGTSTPPTLRASVLPGTEFQELIQFKKDLSTLLSKSFPAYGVTVGADLSSENSSAFRIQIGEKAEEWRLIVKRGDSPLEILKNVELALGAIEGDAKNKNRMLSYIDARLGRKLFTKFKE